MLQFTMVLRFSNLQTVSVSLFVISSHSYNDYHDGMHIPGVHIEFLSPYSPDLNPIEEAFSKIKHFLRRHHEYYSATTDDGILYDMYKIADIITLDDAHGYFAHAGYF
jgi:hypothetical protein